MQTITARAGLREDLDGLGGKLRCMWGTARQQGPHLVCCRRARTSESTRRKGSLMDMKTTSAGRGPLKRAFSRVQGVGVGKRGGSLTERCRRLQAAWPVAPTALADRHLLWRAGVGWCGNKHPAWRGCQGWAPKLQADSRCPWQRRWQGFRADWRVYATAQPCGSGCSPGQDIVIGAPHHTCSSWSPGRIPLPAMHTWPAPGGPPPARARQDQDRGGWVRSDRGWARARQPCPR